MLSYLLFCDNCTSSTYSVSILLREGFDKDQPGCSAPQNFSGHFSKVLPTTYIWVGDFGSGGPRGPRGRGVKFRGVIKGHLWQIFKSLVLGQFLSKWAHIRPKNCPPVWIIWIWSKNLGNTFWGSCSLQKVFLLLLNYALTGTPGFPKFLTFFNNLVYRENFKTLSAVL